MNYLCIYIYIYIVYSNRVKQAVQSTDTGRIPLSNDYVIEVEIATNTTPNAIDTSNNNNNTSVLQLNTKSPMASNPNSAI